jgi:hypothetical protein
MPLAKLVPPFLLLLAAGNIRAEEKTRTFPEYQCRYTLPADDWRWLDKSPHKPSLFVAGKDARLLVMVTVVPAPDGLVMDENAAAAADDGVGVVKLRENFMTKRGGALTTFKGVPCYEYRGVLDGHTVVIRIVIANGFVYQIQVAGGADPVEKRPDFEAIMNGFEFTSPPIAPSPPPPKPDVGRLVRKVLGYGLLGGLLLGFLYKASRGEWTRPKEVRKVGPGTTPGSRG